MTKRNGAHANGLFVTGGSPITNQATIHDVAKLAGVGSATVSRVLNSTAPVSESTRQTVIAAINQLKFVPSPAARKLSLGKTFTIACIVPFFTRPSFVERLRGVSGVFDESEYDLIVYNVESSKRRSHAIQDAPRPDRTDGVILMSMSPSDDDRLALKRFGLPVVLIDAHHADFISVMEDSVAGGRKATQHLLNLGHTRIGFIGGPLNDTLNFTQTSTAMRLKGYKQALHKAKVDLREDYIVIDEDAIGQNSIGKTRRLVTKLMQQTEKPTAIFATSDIQAIGVLQAAKDLGLDVPRDLSVVGYDDIEVAQYLELTTVSQNLHLSGKRGAELLLQALTQNKTTPQLEPVPNELIIRNTTAPYHNPSKPSGALRKRNEQQ